MPRFNYKAPGRGMVAELLRRLDVTRLLRDAGLARMRQRGKEVFGLCPSPEHKDHKVGSWSMHAEPGSALNGQSYCYACGYHGNALEVLARLKRMDELAAFDLAVRYAVDVAEPEDEVLPVVQLGGWYTVEPVDMPPAQAIMRESDCFNYLRSRAIGPEDIADGGLLDWREAQRVLIPVTLFGRVVSWDARLYGTDRRPGVPADTRAHKVITPASGHGGGNSRFALLGLDAADRSTGKLTLVEGWASRIRAMQAGLPNVVANRTAELTERKAALLGWADDVMVLREPDRGGELMEASVKGWLATEGRRIRVILCDEDMDPADYTVTGLRRLIERHA